MNKLLVKVAALTFSVIIMAAIVPTVHAWGPERPTYTNESPSDHVTFNSITDNIAIGDERNFVRIAEAGINYELVDTLAIEPGKEYIVYIYYHNNAASNLNSTGVGIANGEK